MINRVSQPAGFVILPMVVRLVLPIAIAPQLPTMNVLLNGFCVLVCGNSSTLIPMQSRSIDFITYFTTA